MENNGAVKSVTTWLFITALLVGAVALQAADPNDAYLEQCRAQIGQRYGVEPKIKLISVRRSGRGVVLKLAVSVEQGPGGEENVQFTSCQLDRGQLPALSSSPSG